MSRRGFVLGGHLVRSGHLGQPSLANGRKMARIAVWGQPLVLAYLIAGCGGTPSVESGREEPSASGGAGGATSAPQPKGGSGPGVSIQEGTAGGGGGDNGPSVCGNGKVEASEACDDGNQTEGDGCSANCTVRDPYFDCADPGKSCKRWVICGDGIIEYDEKCDDRNTKSGDGCSGNCSAVEEGWDCPRPDKPCIQRSKCGNGQRERGESCDDGQSTPKSGDGCSATCQLESGYWCPSPGQLCVKESCGDGQRTFSEQCDDGNARSGDGCSDGCQLESGWSCTANGCTPICGDSLLVTGEECDDANRTTGDGCSSACRQEPYFRCDGKQPSQCVSTIACGNKLREPGEICDPPEVDQCLAGCQSFSPTTGFAVPVCGNSVIEMTETCDPPAVGQGCDAFCHAETGWVCSRPGLCSRVPFCGDGRVGNAEACDDGNETAGDGCNTCAVEANWTCFGLGPSKCVPNTCGDGILSPTEQCDDKNGAAGDGCGATCTIEDGWVCPIVGAMCRPICGDSRIVGTEKCDDGNIANGDGCHAGCREEPGYTCPDPGKPCVPSACGNSKTESGESCDDGNKTAGDGCSPTCQKEPTIHPGPDPVVDMSCGDGLVTDTEECDDGNTAAEDGCDSTCKKEQGFDCVSKLDLPTTAEFQVTYRDFKAANATTAGGHPDFQYKITNHQLGIAGSACTTANTATCGRLDKDGKPVLQSNNNQATTGIRDASTFGLFFRSTNPTGVNGFNGAIQIMPFNKTLVLQQSAPKSETYSYDAQGQFFPLLATEGFGRIGAEVPLCNNNQGVNDYAGNPVCDRDCDSTCQGKNFLFTTELRYFFQYKGGETLTFRGDDDVWVYVNGRLAVDIGGVHEAEYGRVVLGDDGAPSGTDSNCSVHANPQLAAIGNCYTDAEKNDATDARFGLSKGKVYEIVLFHAERHTHDSNFLLTLSGFLAPRSYCSPICGDGILVAGEVCDDGAKNQDGVSGVCNKTCTKLAFCGDGVLQSGEQCDNGKNTDLYQGAGMSGPCAPGCVPPPYCGDGSVQGTEQCDNGLLNSETSYGPASCTTGCKLGAYCGDGVVNGGEACDLGPKNGTTYGLDSCTYDCKPGPFCGDGARNGAEQCDEGPTGGPSCEKDCTLKPFCGDGVIETGEICDWGQFASPDYGSCTSNCVWAPHCGDGIVQTPWEECDDGVLGNTGEYNHCTADCHFGPRCGDATLQADKGEKCDNGRNDDVYKHTITACGPGCQPPPYCGDGALVPSYELCDFGPNNNDTTYEGCTTHCDWGPYCGDNKLDPQGGEQCDKGKDNVAYGGTDKTACGLDCKPAPYCGDGERNGSEQCDLGTVNNTGAYGGCKPDCTLAPWCGDKNVDNPPEECDAGPTGSRDCTSNCKKLRLI